MLSVRALFGHPQGLLGPIAGWIMAARSSNRRRNRWVIELLAIERTDRVLEIGFGPGFAIREISRIVTDGVVCGVDHSTQMLRQAQRRNAAAIDNGRVQLLLGSVETLPALKGPFDKVLAVNTMKFWRDPEKCLGELRQQLRPGGRIAIVDQPRGPGASDASATASGVSILEQLSRAGFTNLQTHTLALKPAAVCVLATNPNNSRLQPPT
jgi:SAM-dependent methyltransferase